MAKFDLAAARKAGYDDSSILEGVAKEQPGFDLKGARAAGYDDTTILNGLAGQDFGKSTWDTVKDFASTAVSDVARNLVAAVTPERDQTTEDMAASKPAAAAGLTVARAAPAEPAAVPYDFAALNGRKPQSPAIEQPTVAGIVDGIRSPDAKAAESAAAVPVPALTKDYGFNRAGVDLRRDQEAAAGDAYRQRRADEIRRQVPEATDDTVSSMVESEIASGKQAAPSSVSNSEFDFDTHKQYQDAGTIERGVARGVNAIKQQAAGLHEFIGDTVGADGYANAMADTGKKLDNEAAAIGDRSQYLTRNWEGAISSIVSQTPGLAVAALSGGSIPLLMMGAQTFGDEYQTGKAAGLSYAERTTRAGINGVAEIIGEKIGMPSFAKVFKDITKGVPTDQLLKDLAKHVAREIPGEELTTAIQFSNDKFAPYGLNKEAGLQQYLGQAADTLVQTVMQAGAMGSVGIAKSLPQARRDQSATVAADVAKDNAMAQWASAFSAPKGGLTRAAAVAVQTGATARAAADQRSAIDATELIDAEGAPNEGQGRSAEPVVAGDQVGSDEPTGSTGTEPLGQQPVGGSPAGAPGPAGGTPMAARTPMQSGIALITGEQNTESDTQAALPVTGDAQDASAVQAAIPQPQQGDDHGLQEKTPETAQEVNPATTAEGIDAAKPQQVAPQAGQTPGTQGAAQGVVARVGTTPKNAEDVTVRDGVVYLGRYPAQNFETGEDITVSDSSFEAVSKALNDAGALSKKQRIYGGMAAPAEAKGANPYKQAFNTLTAGSMPQGVKDPAQAKAAFDAGQIKSAGDLRRFEELGYPVQKQPKPPKPRKPRTQKAASLMTSDEFGESARKRFIGAIKAIGGIKVEQASDITGEPAHLANRMSPGLFRTGGNALDLVARRIHELGYLSDADYNDVDGGVEATRELVNQALGKDVVMTASERETYNELSQQEQYLAEQMPARNEATAEMIADDFEDDDIPDFADLGGGSNDELMAALGFSQEEIDAERSRYDTQGQYPQAPEGTPARGSQADHRTGENQVAEAGFDLEGQSPAQIAAADKKAKTEADRAEREASKAAGQNVTADQVDMFNTQGGLFGSNRDDVPAKAASKPATLQGTKYVAQRQVNASEKFIESVVEQFGLTRAEAGRAWDYYVKHKLVKIDAVGGQYSLKDGRLWDGDAMRKAAESGQPEQRTQELSPLTKAMNDLAEVRVRIADQGRVVDDRLLERERQLKKAVDDIRAESERKPSTNTVFTEDAAAAARALLKKKLGQLNTGIDPEVMQAGITLAGYHIEKGARSFAAYAKAMLADLGDSVKPYLKSWYAAVSLDPRAAGFDGMDSLADIQAADVDANPAEPAKHENATAPEHVAVGVDDRELGEIVAEFNSAHAAMTEGGDEQVTHVFDAPAKREIVRLGDKAKVYNKDHGWMTVDEAKARIAEWKDHVAKQGAGRESYENGNAQRVVLSLFDLTGKWSQPWEDAGYQVFRFDIQDDPAMGDVNNFSTGFFNDWFGDFDGMDIYAVLAACPCTDFAVSGARHFAAKDKDGRTVASVKLVHQTLNVVEYFKPAVWAIENPVGRIESLGGLPPWRLSFDPNHLGDPYTKKTLLWGRFNADLPIAPVEATEGSKMHKLYGGKSMATKNARSATPEGFSYGFFMANNAVDNPVMAVANKYDRLDRNVIEQAIEAGVTEAQISEAVDDYYYMDLDDAAANDAIRALLPDTPPAKQAPTETGPIERIVGDKLETTLPEVEHVTSKGKIIKGVIAKTLTLEQARTFDLTSWKKDGGIFIHMKHVVRPEAAASAESAQPANVAAPVSEKADTEVETKQPTTLDELIGAVDAGYKAHFDYAGVDGRTVWIEKTDNGWVMKSRDDGSGTTITKGGGGPVGGWAKYEALNKAESDAKHRFTEWTESADITDDIVRAKRRLRDAKADGHTDKVDAIEKELRELRKQAMDEFSPAEATPQKDLAPGTRVNGAREKDAAERLDLLVAEMEKTDDARFFSRNEPETSAKVIVKDVISELRKPSTVNGVIGQLETASSRLMRNYGAFARVIDEVIESLDNTGEAATNKVQEDTQDDAGRVPEEGVPAGRAGENQEQRTDGDRTGKPLDAGLAGSGAAPAGKRGVSDGVRSAVGSGEGRTGNVDGDAPGTDGDRSNGRAGNGAAEHQLDHTISDEDGLGEGGLGAKYRDNIAAIKIIKTLETDGRVATPDERKALARYVGWGALKGVFDPDNKTWAKQHKELRELLNDTEWESARASIRNAHYTSPVVIKSMYSAIDRLGFKGGRILEPSMGSGNFFGLMPAAMRGQSKLHGVELDSLTSRLARALYPNAVIATATGFQEYQVPAGYFDMAYGNPPFGSEPIVDRERNEYSGFSIHNYFIARMIDKTRDGGIVPVIVSHSFMDALSPKAREWIAARANLLGAVRLPETAFKNNAGTEVVTDILFFQKTATPEKKPGWINSSDVSLVNPKTGEAATVAVNDYFGANPRNVLGRESLAGSMYRADSYTVEPTGDLAKQLQAFVESLPANVYTPIERAIEELTTADNTVPDGVKPGSYYLDGNGAVRQRGNDVAGMRVSKLWEVANAGADKRMRGMIQLRDLLRWQMRAELNQDTPQDAIESGRAALNKAYDAFVKTHGYLNSQVNRRIFLDDTESALVQALEFDYDAGITKARAEASGLEEKKPSAVKADILKRRVLFPPSTEIKVSNAQDALLASLNEKGRVDMSFMAAAYDKPAAEIVDELGDLLFEDPQGGHATADEYLSGDVKTKLAEAKSAAAGDAKFDRNVKALEKVIPGQDAERDFRVDRRQLDTQRHLPAVRRGHHRQQERQDQLSGGDRAMVRQHGKRRRRRQTVERLRNRQDQLI
jgi:hypothetical protein